MVYISHRCKYFFYTCSHTRWKWKCQRGIREYKIWKYNTIISSKFSFSIFFGLTITNSVNIFFRFGNYNNILFVIFNVWLSLILSNNSFLIIQGTNGITMFYLETRNEDGSLNGIKIEVCYSMLPTYVQNHSVKERI